MHKVFLIQNLQDFLSEHQKFKLEVSRTSLNRYLANGLVTEARSLNGSGVPGGFSGGASVRYRIVRARTC